MITKVEIYMLYKARERERFWRQKSTSMVKIRPNYINYEKLMSMAADVGCKEDKTCNNKF